MKKKSCIVTGGSGFIGSHLLELLLNNSTYSTIYVLDIVPPSNTDYRVKFIYCDIRKPISADIPEGCDTCYHLAALCKEPGYDWDEYFKTNYVGTNYICSFAESCGINNLIFTSTMMVYRASDNLNTEESLTAPDTAYGMSKLLAELSLKEWHAKAPNTRNLCIVRPGVVFGRGEGANYTRLYYSLKHNRFAYIGRKDTIKGSIYVKDLVNFLNYTSNIIRIQGTFNLVYPELTSIENICDAMCKVYGFSPVIPVVPYRFALFVGYFFELLAILGLKTSIHHRRIQKLYFSTNVSPKQAFATGFQLMFSFQDALRDWQTDCYPKDIY